MQQPREAIVKLEKAKMQKTYLAFDHEKLLRKLIED